MEVAAGAAVAGARAMVSMKHVGMNVASDPFMTLAYTGIKGGLVIVVCDDPLCTAPRTSRIAATGRGLQGFRMLEPGDAQECHDFVKIAFDMSEQFDTPVSSKEKRGFLTLTHPLCGGEKRIG